MKNVFLPVVAILFAGVIHAQVQLGIKGGANLATVRYLNEENNKARLAFHLGLIAEIPVQENLFARPEVLYSSKGFGFSASQFRREGSVRLNYISVPLLVGFRPAVNAALMAGPEIGFLQKAVSRSDGFTTDMTTLYRRFDAGFDLGFAYYFNKAVGLEARYNYGFKDLVNTLITDSNGNIIGQGKTGANSVLQLSFFCFFSQ